MLPQNPNACMYVRMLPARWLCRHGGWPRAREERGEGVDVKQLATAPSRTAVRAHLGAMAFR
eukprot:6190353-Pleurochrysis_carterae.AAC.1